jgi:hypothetical protein
MASRVERGTESKTLSLLKRGYDGETDENLTVPNFVDAMQ